MYADFFRKMGWKQVGTLSESGQELPEYHILLQDYLSIKGITIAVKRKILRAAQTFDLSQVTDLYFDKCNLWLDFLSTSNEWVKDYGWTPHIIISALVYM